MTTQAVKFEYEADRNILFTVDDFEIATAADADAFWKLYRDRLEAIGRTVHIVTAIDGLFIKDAVYEYYGRLAKEVSQAWFINFARYGSTAVGRIGVRQAAHKARFETGIYKSREEAAAAVLAAGDRPLTN